MALEVLRKKYLGDILLEKKLITKEKLEESLKEALARKVQIGKVLLEKEYISESDLLEALSVSLGVVHRKLEDIKNPPISLIPEKTARKFVVAPLEIIGNDNLVVAMADPANVVYKDELQRITGKKISAVLSSEKEIKDFIENFYVRTSLSGDIDADDISVNHDDLDSQEDLDEDADSAPVIRYVNSIFFDAITRKASDIHLEPFEKTVSFRMRLDGDLVSFPAPQKKYYAAIVSRIKIMSDLNIAERRLPQDGKCRVSVNGTKVDIRVSVLPVIWGEKIVLRILAQGNVSLGIESIGFSPSELEKFKEAISAPYGMLLVTGPTSSGKTTTLYSALTHINTEDINIVTAEDPVEYELKGINQVQMKPEIGLDFSAALRSFLRQDPDVILVGEMRDKETAQIAIQAALTGHLVFSTVHTNDTISTISRLSFMGVESYLVADAVNLIIAQRLVRRICTSCKQEVKNLPDSVYERLGITKDTKIYEGRGCKICEGSGYKGRIAIFEILTISRELRRLIAINAPENEMRELAMKDGLVTLRMAAINKLKEGITTVSEVLSVTSANK